jgi:hypothetical protein
MNRQEGVTVVTHHFEFKGEIRTEFERKFLESGPADKSIREMYNK